MARRNKITVASGMLKDELIKTITKGLRKIEAKKKPATVAVKTSKQSPAPKTAKKTSKKKSTKTPKTKTVQKPKPTASKTTPAKRIKISVKKTAVKKSPVKQKTKKAPAKTLAAGKPKTVRSPEKAASQTRSTPVEIQLPERYNDHRLVALARDPNWAYTYWDLSPARVRDLLSSANQTTDKVRWILRVHSDPEEAKGLYFDTDIDMKTGSYYLDLSRPGARFIVEIGVIDTSGMFRVAAQSNPVLLPTDQPSQTIAPEGTAPSEALKSTVGSK